MTLSKLNYFTVNIDSKTRNTERSIYVNPPEVTSTPASLENAYDTNTLTVVPENEDESISSTEGGGSIHENGGEGGNSRTKVHPISRDIADFPLVHRKQGVGAISSINDDSGYQNRDQNQTNMQQQEENGGKSKPKIVIKRKINQVCLLSNNFRRIFVTLR